ncbi:hypothetical protein M9H77_19666 [Catharanthus roseus]|uniref:Uncharacterized protein n=1 Tax=Catharanthus roseus TaxID=4058 RepID=A0ACC0BB13_CATRO|nr:hypothetical protein M9H77_19666 [Catharanthus roseus]
MAWSEPEIMCKKHPDQRQQPGICSSCLREKLAKLPSLRFAMVPSRSSSVSSSRVSSNSSSICMSPTKDQANHQGKSSDSGVNGRTNNGLRKSKSSTCVARSRRGRNGGDGKKKEGFWSKLIRSTSVKTKGVFVHSSNKTTKERSILEH